MMLARLNGELAAARPGTRAACPACDRPTIAKCGPLVTWHWAHEAADCDPWAEPESAWHLAWKAAALHSEVVMRRDGTCHRADIVTTDGRVVELQSTYLPVDQIRAREAFYGPSMVWLYRATWIDRLHFGHRGGFWWRHGSKAMAHTRTRLLWDIDHHDHGREIWRVSLRLRTYGDGSQRILGRVLRRYTHDALIARLREAPPAWRRAS